MVRRLSERAGGHCGCGIIMVVGHGRRTGLISYKNKVFRGQVEGCTRLKAGAD